MLHVLRLERRFATALTSIKLSAGTASNLIVKETPFEIELEGRIRGRGQGKAGDERLLVDARGSFEWGTTTVEVTTAVSAVKEA